MPTLKPVIIQLETLFQSEGADGHRKRSYYLKEVKFEKVSRK